MNGATTAEVAKKKVFINFYSNGFAAFKTKEEALSASKYTIGIYARTVEVNEEDYPKMQKLLNWLYVAALKQPDPPEAA